MLDEIIKRVRNLTQDQQRKTLEFLKTLQTGKQREYQRLKAKSNIDVVIGDRIIQTDTSDISASGIYINAAGKFETNKEVRIVFTIPGIDKSFKLKGIIVRVEESGIAIHFENITPYFKEILDTIIWEKNNSTGDDFL